VAAKSLDLRQARSLSPPAMRRVASSGLRGGPSLYEARPRFQDYVALLVDTCASGTGLQDLEQILAGTKGLAESPEFAIPMVDPYGGTFYRALTGRSQSESGSLASGAQ
jgi:hypothetical protein